MDFDSEAFLQELLETFRIEAREHLQTLTNGLLKLEKVDPSEKPALVEEIFREAHSLKGAARAVDMADIEQLCQAMESVFSACKRDAITLSPAAFDVLHRTLDVVTDLVESDSGQGDTEVTALIDSLEKIERGEMPAAPVAENPPEPAQPAPPAVESPPEPAAEPSPPPPPEPPRKSKPKPKPKKPRAAKKSHQKSATDDTIRIAVGKLDALMLQAEEMLAVKLELRQQYAELRNLQTQVSLWQKAWKKIESDARVLSKTVAAPTPTFSKDAARSLEELLLFTDFNIEQIETFDAHIARMVKQVHRSARSLEVMVDGLLDDMKQVLLHPISLLLDMVPKMVRDLARAQHKEVSLEISGSHIEIDRRILEEMRTPLIHLVRNAVDHGLEPPDVREANGKPRTGTISITVSQTDASKVKITLADDGGGIDVARVKSKAVQQGILSRAEADMMDDDAARMLIFHSALSTSPIITEISGRGLGMAIVQEKINNLGGKIVVVSNEGLGTVFEITLPVTIATFRGILTQVGGRRFILPTNHVTRVTRIDPRDIKTVENKETILLDGVLLPVVSLAQALELPAEKKSPTGGQVTVLVVAVNDEKMAFVADGVIDEQEVLVKGLGPQLVRVRNVSGATILGSGEVVPILNVGDLFKSAVKTTAGRVRTISPAQADRPQKNILVVDDSITSRSLLQNILRAAGYRVKTAVDGVDAFTALRQGNFDLLVSDVEMPRMDGFQLTEKIRADERLSELPVVLVTSLGSQADRERGIDVGADAYVAKSSFDQTNLLNIIARLVG